MRVRHRAILIIAHPDLRVLRVQLRLAGGRSSKVQSDNVRVFELGPGSTRLYAGHRFAIPQVHGYFGLV